MLGKFSSHKLTKSDSFSGNMNIEARYEQSRSLNRRCTMHFQNRTFTMPKRDLSHLFEADEFSSIDSTAAIRPKKPPPDLASIDSDLVVHVNGRSLRTGSDENVVHIKDSSSGYSTHSNVNTSSSASDVGSDDSLEQKKPVLISRNESVGPVLPELPPKDYKGNFIAVRPDVVHDEAERMEDILLSIEPEDLYVYTLARLNNRDPTVIEALKKLLPSMTLSCSKNESSSSDGMLSENDNLQVSQDDFGSITSTSCNLEQHFEEIHIPETHNNEKTETKAFEKHKVRLKSSISNVGKGSQRTKVRRSLTSVEHRKKCIPVVKQHCVRCHKNFKANSKSKCEMRCQLPHPEDMVIVTKQKSDGTDFKCLACGKGFHLPDADCYEEGTSSMLTGFCIVDKHTTDPTNVVFRDERGAAKTCEANGCVEFYV